MNFVRSSLLTQLYFIRQAHDFRLYRRKLFILFALDLRTIGLRPLFLVFNQLGCDIVHILSERVFSHIRPKEVVEFRGIGSHSFDHFRLDLADLTSELANLSSFCKFHRRLRYLFVNIGARCKTSDSISQSFVQHFFSRQRIGSETCIQGDQELLVTLKVNSLERF